MPFMPLFVKVSEWKQTENSVTIKIPSYGTIANNVDIFTCDKYVKAHYGQHIFELFLWGLIDTTRSSCVVTPKEIIFELSKWVPEHWEKLEANLDKSQKRELRKHIIEEAQKDHQKKAEEAVVKNAELKRQAVREQITIDSKRIEWIKTVKESEKQKALQELDLPNKIIKDDFKKSNDTTKHKSKRPSKHKNEISVSPLGAPNGEEESPVQIPLPRKPQTMTISFTEREFPTPKRESMEKEEEEWLKNQAAARRSAGFAKEDLRPEERNPQWLKAKGDQFFRDKNYLGAISAYSEGIRVSKDFVDLYINRSAAHFELGNFQKTIEDCSTALDKMKPAVAANLDMRAKCIARRAAALCTIGLFDEGIREFDCAIEMVRKKDDSLRVDIERMKQKCVDRKKEKP